MEFFKDLDPGSCPENVEQLEMDDLWFEEWDTIIEDEDFITLAADNLPTMEHLDPLDLTISQLDNLSEQEINDSDGSGDDNPGSIHNLIQKPNFTDL